MFYWTHKSMANWHVIATDVPIFRQRKIEQYLNKKTLMFEPYDYTQQFKSRREAIQCLKKVLGKTVQFKDLNGKDGRGLY